MLKLMGNKIVIILSSKLPNYAPMICTAITVEYDCLKILSRDM